MLYFWCILFIWNTFSALANLVRNDGHWSLMMLISVIASGCSFAEVIRYYKRSK